MIRRDYFLRMVQEMAQVLARVVLLKHRREYDQALAEINDALRSLREETDSPGAETSLEDWIALCKKHEDAASGLMIAVADLVKEQGDLFALRQQADESQRASALSLGLFLEALVTGNTFVSAELLSRVEELIERTRGGALGPAVFRRLLTYYELRGKLAKAEDVLFDWLEAGDATTRDEGLAFYQRQSEKTDAELEQGGLPREELEQGRDELLKRGAQSA